MKPDDILREMQKTKTTFSFSHGTCMIFPAKLYNAIYQLIEGYAESPAISIGCNSDPFIDLLEKVDSQITSFFPPGEPTRETCITELLKALKKGREAGREIEFWERKLREAE